MAGNYPDAPSNRIPYDRDGTVVLLNGVEVSANTARVLNDDSGGTVAATYGSGSGASGSWTLFFPRLMDIYGYTAYGWASSSGLSSSFQYSVNATNASDGTWVNMTGGNVNGDLRSPTVATYLGVRALKCNTSGLGGNSMALLHVYGKPSTGENTDRLEIWHPTLDQRVGGAYFDWGDIQRTSTADRTFRVKNLSSTLTANTVMVTFNAETDTTPAVAGWHYLSSDGTNFSSSLSVGSLAPGALSPVYTVRRTVPSNAQLSLWYLRILAEAASWS